jgi:hypothetical protein
MNKNTMNVLTRIAEKQDRAQQLREDLERSSMAKAVMPELFAKGAFSMTVTGKQTPGSRFLGLRNLPYKAVIKYKKSGAELSLTYEQWSVLSKTYYSPDVHRQIERYWNSEGT